VYLTAWNVTLREPRRTCGQPRVYVNCVICHVAVAAPDLRSASCVCKLREMSLAGAAPDLRSASCVRKVREMSRCGRRTGPAHSLVFMKLREMSRSGNRAGPAQAHCGHPCNKSLACTSKQNSPIEHSCFPSAIQPRGSGRLYNCFCKFLWGVVNGADGLNYNTRITGWVCAASTVWDFALWAYFQFISSAFPVAESLFCCGIS
jgi:hypothetical protein